MDDIRDSIRILERGYRRKHRHHAASDINVPDLLAAVDHLISDVKLITGLYDVPYLAGYNKNGTAIYFDKELPQFMEFNGKNFDIYRIIAVHEIVEASLLHSYRNNLFYLEAHQIATRIEKDYVEALGLEWQDYNDFVEGYVNVIESRPIYKNIPADIDTQPYIDEGDQDLLSRMGLAA